MQMRFIKKRQRRYREKQYIALTNKLNRVNSFLAGVSDPDLWEHDVALARDERASIKRRLSTVADKLRST